MLDMKDRVVMVTGANGNLGSTVAKAFHRAGANLALVGRKIERIHSTLPDLVSEDRVFVAPSTDLTKTDAVQALVTAILDTWGRIDVLANTVGGYRGSHPVHETSLETWDFMWTLNTRTVVLLSRAVVPVMLGQKYGKIIHTASRNALKGSRNTGAYSASKAGVVRITEALSAEVKARGINVNCILPGTINTPENRAAMPDADFSQWVDPTSIAKVFLFLASDASIAIHGAALPVYGLS
jgi:NAD(P)-dependent dehydrogenase (short-subunit alcohol dehydrogenase family)